MTLEGATEQVIRLCECLEMGGFDGRDGKKKFVRKWRLTDGRKAEEGRPVTKGFWI